MQWKTALTKVTQDGEIVRGYNLSDLIQQKSFVETIFLLLQGKLPTTQETGMMNALLTADDFSISLRRQYIHAQREIGSIRIGLHVEGF
jgi:citrate synthase